MRLRGGEPQKISSAEMRDICKTAKRRFADGAIGGLSTEERAEVMRVQPKLFWAAWEEYEKWAEEA